MSFENSTLLCSLSLKASSAASHLYQIPKGSVLTNIDSTVVSSDNDVNSSINTEKALNCQFNLPNIPPHIPDFIVVDCDNYAERGGCNIFGFTGAENLIP